MEEVFLRQGLSIVLTNTYGKQIYFAKLRIRRRSIVPIGKDGQYETEKDFVREKSFCFDGSNTVGISYVHDL
jgi:hypothetical protein